MEAKMGVDNWSTTPADNAIKGNIDWSEGMAPAKVNDSARQMMADLAKVFLDRSGALTSTGSAGVFALATNTGITQLKAGLRFTFKANVDFTAGSTLNVDSKGGKKLRIVDDDGERDIVSGEVVASGFYDVIYDTAANSGAGGWIVQTADFTVVNAAIAAVSSSLTTHTANTSNPHFVTKAQVGLGNADNTADANKPVSTATQTALNAKASLSGATFTGLISGVKGAFTTNSTNTVVLNKPNDASYAGLNWSVNGLANWLMYTTNTGSGDLILQSREYTTTGGFKASIWSINWATGVQDFKITPTVLDNQIWHAGNFDPDAYAALSDATFLGPVTVNGLLSSPGSEAFRAGYGTDNDSYMSFYNQTIRRGYIQSHVNGFRLFNDITDDYLQLSNSDSINALQFYDSSLTKLNTVWHSGNFTPSYYATAAALAAITEWPGVYTGSDPTFINHPVGSYIVTGRYESNARSWKLNTAVILFISMPGGVLSNNTGSYTATTGNPVYLEGATRSAVPGTWVNRAEVGDTTHLLQRIA
jgi:hypothetical protein